MDGKSVAKVKQGAFAPKVREAAKEAPLPAVRLVLESVPEAPLAALPV